MIDPAPPEHSVNMTLSALLPRPPASTPADEELVRELVFEEWLPVVLRWCTRLGGPTVDPEDAAHDALLIVMTRMRTLRRPEDFPAWIFGITRRVLASHRRRAWVRRWVPGLFPDLPEPRPDPEGSFERREAGRRVHEIVDAMPTDLREVLVLCDLEERTDEAAAQLLGIPTGTAKSRLRRARQRFASDAIAAGLVPCPQEAS